MFIIKKVKIEKIVMKLKLLFQSFPKTQKKQKIYAWNFNYFLQLFDLIEIFYS